MSDFENQNYNSGTNGDYKWNYEGYGKSPIGSPNNNNKKNKKGVKIFLSIVGCLLAIAVLVFAGIGVYSVMPNSLLDEKQSSSNQNEEKEQNKENIDFQGITLNDRPQTENPTSLDGAPSSKEIVKSVKPSVVAVVQYAKSNYGTYEKVGSGSGIIISQDGYIVTNAHVIEGAAGVLVVLDNGEEHEATIVGADTKTDIAVIKIDAENLVYAELGNSDQIEVGEWVIAIGNPGGLDLAGSVTKGIVSAVNRPVKHGSYTLNFIQTDAAINPGNSGGALVNEYGQVIGINSSKFVATDYEGIGFAIPINDAKPIVDEIILNGRVTGRVRIGVIVSSIDEVNARLNDYPTGLLISGIDRTSDIANKNVQLGDVITKIDGVKVNDIDELSIQLEKYKPGDTVTLTIFRRTRGKADATFDVTIELSEDMGDSDDSNFIMLPGVG